MTAWAPTIKMRLLAGVFALASVQYSTSYADEASDKAIANFGMQLAETFNKYDSKELQALLDMKALGRRAAEPVFKSEKDIADFATGIANTGPNGVIPRLISNLQRVKGSVQYMKLVTRGSEVRPLLRWNLGDTGFDYCEYVVERDKTGAYRVVDWHQLSTGQLFSMTVGSISVLLIDPNPGLLKSVLGIQTVDQSIIKQIHEASALERSGKFTEALTTIEKMPPDIANSRIFLVKQVALANQSQNEALYRRALSRLADRFGNDPNTAFILLDHYFYEGNLEKGLQSVAAIESRVGHDGMTELVKANLYYKKGIYDKMVVHANESVRLEPDREDGYFSLALGYAGNGQYGKAIETYKLLSTRFGYQFTRKNFAEDPALKQFVQSAEYKAWLPAK